MIACNLSEKNISINSQNNGESYDNYIAIDWSLKNMAIARLTKRMTVPHIIDVPSDLKEVKLYLGSLKGSKILTIEETTSSQWLYVELVDHADKVIICDPFRNHLLNDGPKNDKTDAGKLCQLLKGGMLKEVFHSTNKIYELRKLVSFYDDEVKASVRLMNQKSALYRAENKLSKNKQAIDQTEINTFIERHLDEKISSYKESRISYEKKFLEMVKGNKTIKALISIPGIGIIRSVTILAMVVDARRFKHINQYMVYCGLAKYEKLSGGRSYGRRSPRCNRLLKGIYKSAALTVIKTENPIRDFYEYLIKQKGLHPQDAKNQVARYIARVSLGVIKSGKKYKPFNRNIAKEDNQSAHIKLR